MKICLFSYRGNPYSGGQGIYLHQLTRALAALGHQLDVVVGPPYPRDLSRWATVHKLPNLNLWGKYRGEWLPHPGPIRLLSPLNLLEFMLTRLRFFPEPLAFSLRALGWLAGAMQGRGFDLLHDVQSLGYGNLAMRCFGLPMVTTVHHPLTIDRRKAFARDRTFEEMYHTAVFFPVAMQGVVIRRMERVITNSQSGKAAIHADFRVPEDRISIVPGGLDTGFFHNPGVYRRRKDTLLFVGNTDDWKKGARFLLHALALLPRGVRLRVVDDPYPAKKLLHEEAGRMNLDGRITFLGKLGDEALREEYCRCTILVQPSLFEGFGLPAAEAMACETPVVASAVGAVPEVVRGDAGLLVPPADAQALADAILALLDEPHRRESLGQAGRKRMVRHFDWSIAAEKTAAVYRTVTGTGTGTATGGPGTGGTVTDSEGKLCP